MANTHQHSNILSELVSWNSEVLVGHLPHMGQFAASLLQSPAAAGRLGGIFHPDTWPELLVLWSLISFFSLLFPLFYFLLPPPPLLTHKRQNSEGPLALRLARMSDNMQCQRKCTVGRKNQLEYFSSTSSDKNARLHVKHHVSRNAKSNIKFYEVVLTMR